MGGHFEPKSSIQVKQPDTHSTLWGDLLKLLHPGVGLKRWLFLGSVGIAVCSVGIAVLLRQTMEMGLPNWLPIYVQALILVVVGVFVVAMAWYGMFKTLGPALVQSPTHSIDSLATSIYTRRSLGKGPRIVAIGGGTGQGVLLRGLKQYTDNLTAIVTVGDDGGSSGRLRDELGVLPPGDFRNCLVALSSAEPLVTELFQYRFDEGDGLKGHSFGNLFIVAMTNVTQSFEKALHESSRVLAVHGQIVPATTANLHLSARLKNGESVYGESNITARGEQIDRLFIDPENAEASPLAIEAIEQAQIIVIGPGSLYTSILPNLLVNGISEAIHQSDATKIYVANVATEKGETEGYSIADHLDALQAHTSIYLVDHVVGNDLPIEPGPNFFGTPVIHDGRSLGRVKPELCDLTDVTFPVRHDSDKLAHAILGVYHRVRKTRSPMRLGIKLY